MGWRQFKELYANNKRHGKCRLVAFKIIYDVRPIIVIKGRRRRWCQRMRWLHGITDAMNMNLGKLQEMVRDKDAWHATVHGVPRVRHYWATEQQS